MPGIIDELLAAATAPNKVQQKQQNIMDQSALKQQQVFGEMQQFNGFQHGIRRETGYGNSTASGVDTDAAYLSNADLRDKYGDGIANNIIHERERGQTDYNAALLAPSTTGGTLTDTSTGIGMGVMNSVGGIAALGTGLVNNNAGAHISNLLKQATEAVQEKQSPALKASREIYNAATGLAERDNREQYLKDREEYGDFPATMMRVGRDAVDAVQMTTNDPTLAIEGIAQAGGSLMTAGPLGKGVGAIGSRLPGASRVIQASDEGVTAARLATGAKMPTAIAAMESGGVYQDTMNQVMGMEHHQLEQSSAYYRKVLEMTGDPEEARLLTASTAAKKAAAQMAPFAAGAGVLVSRFEANPLSVSSLRKAGQNILRETVEEGVQGGAASVLSNLAIQEYADENREATQGTGQAIGQGALYGYGIAGLVQSPGVAARAAMSAGKKTGEVLTKRVDAIHEANAKASPISPEKLTEASTAINVAAPDIANVLETVVAAAPVDEQPAVSEFVQSLLNLGTYTEGQFGKENLDLIAMDSKSKFEAINKLAMVTADPLADPSTRLDAGLALMNMEREVIALAERNPDAFAALPDDHEAAVMANSILGSIEAAFKNEEIQKVGRAVMEILESNPVAPVTEESIATPQGQKDAQTTIEIAQVAPEKANLDSIQTILAQEALGNYTLTPEQKRALQLSSDLLQAERSRPALDLGADALTVSKEITLAGGQKGPSLAEHAKGIYTALRNGDTTLATQRLSELGSFAQHMGNKVEALNKHIQAGNKAPKEAYQAWNAKARTWFDAGKQIYFNPGSEASIKMAKSIAHEAGLITAVYNNMVDSLGLPNTQKLPEPVVNSPLVTPVVSPVPAENQAKKDALVTRDREDQKALEEMTEDEYIAAINPTGKTTDADDIITLNLGDLDRPSDAKKVSSFKDKSGKETDVFMSEEGNFYAEQDGQVVGMIERDGDETMNSVVQEAQGKGIGSGLAAAMIRQTPFAQAGSLSPAGEKARRSAFRTVRAERTKAKAEPVEETVSPLDQDIESMTDALLNKEINKLLARGKKRTKEENEVLSALELESAKRTDEQAEPEAKTEPVKAVAPVVQASPAPVLKGMAAVFPTLFNAADISKNAFLRAFKLPAEQNVRFFGEEAPLTVLRDVLDSSSSLGSILGPRWTRKFDYKAAEAWTDFMKSADRMNKEVDKAIFEYLHTAKEPGKKTRMQLIFEGSSIQTAEEGLILNLAEPVTRKSKNDQKLESLKLNKALSETASIAAMNWLLNSDRNATQYDVEDIAKTLGIPEYKVTSAMYDFFNRGVVVTNAIEDLAQKITSYWGVKPDLNGFIGDQQGVTESMARELILAMKEAGMLKEMSSEGVVWPEGKTAPIKYEVVTPFLDSVTDQEAKRKLLRNTSSLLDELMLLVPEEARYVGKNAVPPSSQNQLRNPQAKLTRQQKNALEVAQKTAYLPDLTMIGVYGLLGSSGVVEAFNTVTDPNNFNVNHLQSIEGQNVGLVSSFNELGATLAEIRAAAETEGTNITETPTRYKYEFSAVNRMQMQGAYTPQSSKLMREAMLPTWSTLDLSGENQQALDNFRLALAQGLDISVHKKTKEGYMESLDKTLASLAPAIEMVQDLLTRVNPDLLLDQQATTPVDIPKLKQLFKDAKVPLSPLSLHAVVEYAKYQKAENKKAFRTSLYLEADGMTNGPANAMMLLTGGTVNPEWVVNMERGGLYLNQPDASANTKNGGGLQDMYTATAEKLQGIIKDVFGSVAKEYFLFKLYDEFSPDFSMNEKGEVNINRNLIKNPLTVIIYGSGINGVANKMTSNLVDAIYERMSEAMQRRNENPDLSVEEALFPGRSLEEAQARYKEISVALEDIAGIDTSKLSLQGFTFFENHKEALADTIKRDLAEHMYSAISDTVGRSVMENANLIRKATGFMSIYASKIQKDLLEAAVAKNQAELPNYKKRQLLTVKQMRETEKEAARLAALMGTDTQNYFVTGNGEHSFGVRTSVGLKGNLRKDGHVKGLGDAGVKGTAYVVIGSGDGQMVQNSLVSESSVKEKQLPVFDGINTPVDGIQDTGVQMNTAVWDSWNGNPLQMVATRFGEFLKDTDFSLMDEDTMLALSNAVWEGPRLKKPMSTSKLVGYAVHAQKSLANAAEGHAIRMEVLKDMSMSVDQMAATGTPLVRNGEASTGVTDPAALALEINAKIAQKMNAKEKSVKSLTDLMKHKTDEKNPVAVVTQQDIKKLLNTDFMTADQKTVIRDALNNKTLDGWRILAGTREDMAAFVQSRGVGSQALEDALSKNHKGLTDPESKLIMVFNGEAETLAHEILHASTMQKIFNYVANPKSVTKEVAEAIQRTEALMDQFLKTDFMALDHMPTTQLVSKQLQKAIQRQLDQGNKAVALNEFMAWTLTNRELANQAKVTQATSLGQLIKDAWAALKTLLFGSSFAPKVGKDVYSNLRFNSAILSLQTPTVSELNASSTPLAQESFGNDARITQLENAFGKAITDTLNQRKKIKGDEVTSQDLANEIVLAEKVSLEMKGAFFTMSPQEQLAFNNVVAALATEAHINPQALREANRLFAHVAKTLTVEDFLQDVADESERYYAQAKYNAVIGKSIRGDDQFGRSTILPAFIGLAMVNQEFRDILAKMDMPKGMVSKETGIDGYLENLGYKSMDALGDRFVGTSQSPNILSAMDLLGSKIAEQIQAKETYAEAAMSKAGSFIDGANNQVVAAMQKAADIVYPSYTEAEAEARNKWERSLDGIRAGVAALISEEKGAVVAQAVSENLDKSEVSAWFRDLMSDFIGRTDLNKAIWDMVKTFRSKIQVVRQGYRDDLPKVIRAKFSRELSEKEWGSLYRSMGKSDLGSLMLSGMSSTDALKLASDQAARTAKIAELETELKQYSKVLNKEWATKAKQLAHYMNTGEAGSYLLRNAKAIAQLTSDSANRPKLNQAEMKALEQTIDQLTTLYSVDSLGREDKETLSSLAQSEQAGLEFTLSYLKGQIEEERSKGGERAAFNAYKGHMPFETKEDATLQVADDSHYAELISRGYVRLDRFVGSNVQPMRNMSYYFLPRSAKGAFSQGILQNVKPSSGGVDPTTGYTNGVIVNRYTDPTGVKALTRRVKLHEDATAPLLPVFDSNGTVVAYEQGIDPVKQKMVAAEPDLAAAIGKWRGRQVEEYLGQISNLELVNTLKDTYEKDLANSSRNADKYEDLFKSKDPVIQDALSLMPMQTRLAIEAAFDGKFLVQRNMVKDVVGYREATVGDLWTGNTRLNEKTQKLLKNAAIGIMGNDAYVKLTGAEKLIENIAVNAKVLIVVKSVVVPAINIISNLVHLVSRGVPAADIYRQSKLMTHEIHTYVQARHEYTKLEADLRAATKPNEISSLNAQLQAIEDSNRRLSIWPLLQAGEFTSVTDADMRYDDVSLTSGKWTEYIENAVDKLPDGMRTTGRYLMVSKDTPLFMALQKSVEYGDFVAKGILYRDLTKRQGMTHEEAMGVITEEFVSYDHLPGRTRGKLEKVGLLWFYNFKIRSTKIALSTMRRNPLHTLLALGIPTPTMFGNAGLPIEDNVIMKGLDGSLGYSIGPGQGLNSFHLNPWVNLTN